MFWMFVLSHDPGDRFGCCWPDGLTPVDESFWCPLLVRPMGCGHVIIDGAEFSHSGIAWMTGNPFATMQQLNHRLGHARFQNLPNQCMRHAVTMSLNIDVVVDMHFNGFKPSHLIGLGWQCHQGWRINGSECAGATAWQLLKQFLIQPG